ncbi:MAG: putative sugar O-methyltransferase [Acidobacteriota bacterium]|nr:putative sugar O-methyltransferase [Acidobacteriota bacterium]
MALPPIRLSDDFKAAWTELRRRTEAGAVADVKSYMWDKWAKDFPTDASPEDVLARAFQANQNRGYNFLDAAEDQSMRVRTERARLRLRSAATRLVERAATRLWHYNARSPRLKHLKSYPRVEPLMHKLGLWNDYVPACAALGVSHESFNTAKLFYVSSVVAANVPAGAKRLRVLEIGAGTGVLSVFLRTRLDIRQYAIVDIPEMMLQSSLVVRRFFPDAPLAFSHAAGGETPLPEEGAAFVVPDDAGVLPSDAFDVCLNIDSFQEMDRDQVHGYWALIRRVVKPCGLVVTVNRRKQLREFDNNPLLYPYGDSDVLRWEVDPFFYEGLGRVRKDAHLLRIERARK